MKKLNVALVSLFFGLSAIASTGLVGDDAPIVVQSKEIQIAQVEGISVKEIEGQNTIEVSLAVRYSNSCVAGGKLMSPKIVREINGDQELETFTVIPQVIAPPRRVLCPMIYAPVTIVYHTTVENVYSGSHTKVFNVLGSTATTRLD